MSQFLENLTINNQPTTTVFMDNTEIVGTARPVPVSTTMPIIDQSMKDFLSKPFLVSTQVWSTMDNAGKELTSITPETYLTTNTEWKKKVDGYQLIRGTAVLTVTINATPFQQGKLIVHSLPDIKDFLTYNYDISQWTMHNNVELDCRDSVAILRLPYVAPTAWYNLAAAQTSETKYGWGKFYIGVLSELNSIASSYVDVNVYLHFEDVEFTAPIQLQSGKYKSIEDMEKSTGYSLSAGLHKVSKVATAAADIPLVSSYAKPVAWAADVAGKIASAFGYSKPANDSATVRNAQIISYGTASSDADFAGPRLALRNDNRVEGSTDISIRDEDEMSFAFLKSVESYFSSVSWSVSKAPDDTLTTAIDVIPGMSLRDYNVTRGTKALRCNFEHPVCRISKMFRMYRGGIQLRFKFVKTQFHTGRLQFTFTPGNAATLPGISSIYPMREIIDISAVDEFCLKIPFYFSGSYMSTLQRLGKLDIRVVNTLRAPDTVAQNVNVLMYISYCDDFELAAPATEYFGTQNLVPVSLHSGEAQPMVIGDQPQPDNSLMYCTSSVGEKFMSIRQLISRFTAVFNRAAWSTKRQGIYPYFFGRKMYQPLTDSVTTDRLGGDSLSILAPFYAYYRGGIRLMVASGDNNASLSIANVGNTYSRTLIVGDASDIGPDSASVDWGTFGFANCNIPMYTTNTNAGVHLFETPYYAQTRCSLVPNLEEFNIIPTTMDTPEVFCILGASTLSGMSSTALSRGVAEDFQLAYFLATPPVLRAVT